VNAVDDQALVNRMFYMFNHKFTWPSLQESEERLLFAEPYRSQLRGVALESFRQEIAPFLSLRQDVRAELFYVRNHCGRLTHNMVTFARSHLEVRFPYFDYRLFEFLYAIPASVRGPRQLYHAVLDRELPHLARIPYDRDELLPTSRRWRRGLHAAGVRIRRSINRNVRPVFPERSTLYADYETYLRHELRPWAEGILYDRRTTERGYFDPAFVRSLMTRHLSGLEFWTIGKIAPIVTYELMLRQLVD
jgi:asparagine synthase (glutamine-hydrolysing)